MFKKALEVLQSSSKLRSRREMSTVLLMMSGHSEAEWWKAHSYNRLGSIYKVVEAHYDCPARIDIVVSKAFAKTAGSCQKIFFYSTPCSSDFSRGSYVLQYGSIKQ